LPPEGTLTPLLEHATLERSLALRRIHTEDVIAPGLREDALYRGRFNLTHEDLVVLGQGEGSRSSPYTFATSWSNYLRSTFKPKQFHCFPGILLREDCVYLYILEHKTLPGREDIHEDDAKARPLEVCFFTRTASAPPGEIHVRRVDRSTITTTTTIINITTNLLTTTMTTTTTTSTSTTTTAQVHVGHGDAHVQPCADPGRCWEACPVAT
jgi:hypothetical protein